MGSHSLGTGRWTSYSFSGQEFHPYAQSGFEMDVVSQQAFLLQEPGWCGIAEPAAVVHIPDELRIRPARENGIHGEKGVQKTAGIALLSLQENRLRPSFPFQSMEFLFRKIRDPGTDQGQGFRKGIGVFKGKLGKTGELKRQAAFFLPLFPRTGDCRPGSDAPDKIGSVRALPADSPPRSGGGRLRGAEQTETLWDQVQAGWPALLQGSWRVLSSAPAGAAAASLLPPVRIL